MKCLEYGHFKAQCEQVSLYNRVRERTQNNRVAKAQRKRESLKIEAPLNKEEGPVCPQPLRVKEFSCSGEQRLTPEEFKELCEFARVFHGLLVDIPKKVVMKKMLSKRAHTVLLIEDGHVSYFGTMS